MVLPVLSRVCATPYSRDQSDLGVSGIVAGFAVRAEESFRVSPNPLL